MIDIFVIGGGINGCGLARDAAGRGYSVMLAEMNDLASGTSSWSTKLIHGGLRYLEHYEFRLVREALKEREVLWKAAPHIVWPLRLVLPHHEGLRPAWLLRLGLFLYDHIGGRRLLPATEAIDLRTDRRGAPLRPGFSKAFVFSDCAVDDSRLVVLNARDAAARGAAIRTRTKVVGARQQDDGWEIEVEDRDGRRETVRARLLVNAAGPWVEQVLSRTLGRNDGHAIRLVQGSHIVVRRKYEGDQAYFFQNADGRIFFAIPYHGDFTLIGTTDRDYDGDPANVAISEAEIDYLCASASEYFAEAVTRDDIVWTFSGVRPLYDDGATKAQETTREYVLKLDGTKASPLVSIFGGKITTYRKLAEAVMEKIGTAIGAKGAEWTAGAALPGGDFAVSDFPGEAAQLLRDYPFLGEREAFRLMRAYGTEARAILGAAREAPELGRRFGPSLTEREVEYLIANEWAATAEDVAWRRSKCGLAMSRAELAELDAFLQARRAA